MKRILAVRERREKLHIHNRLMHGVQLRKSADVREVQQNLNILQATNGTLSDFHNSEFASVHMHSYFLSLEQLKF